MCIIIKEMSFYWINGLLVLWSGVITAHSVTAAPGVGTTTSNEISAFIISIRITNRIHNESLEDHQSQNYNILREDVEKVFFEMYSFTPSAQFQEIAEMTFSNGSVIANSTVLFGTKHNSGQTLKNIFITNYHEHPSMTLDLDTNYTAAQEPIPVPLSLLPNIPRSISSMNETTTRPNDHTTTESSDHTQSAHESSISGISSPSPSTMTVHPSSSISGISSSSPSTTTVHPSSSISAISSYSPSTMTVHPSSSISAISSSSPSTTTVHPSSSISAISSSSPSTTTVHQSSSISAASASRSSTTTIHPSSSISAISSSSPSTTTIHPSSSISAISSSSPSTTTIHPNSSISAISSSSPSTTRVHPSSSISAASASRSTTTTVHPSNISAMSASSSSVSLGKTVTQNPTLPEGSGTVETEQGVPGWGIAILVLAAIILFFMLVLLILLLLFWCCWWRQRGFMNVSDPDPMGYYNPDIPMYSTHSTYDSHNGKSLDSHSERPPKNQTGMYAVNK